MASMAERISIGTITEFHRLAGIPDPADPLLSVVRMEDVCWRPAHEQTTVIRDFYVIALKRGMSRPLRYGQDDIAADGCVLHFMAPKQVLRIYAGEEDSERSGWLLLIHPDFLWNSPMAQRMRQYEFFHYRFNRFLQLQPDEAVVMETVLQGIDREQYGVPGRATKEVILAQVGLLLAYADRFYQLQQAVTAQGSKGVLPQLEALIDDYLKRPELLAEGLPRVSYLAACLCLSPNYLNRLVRSLTGHSTQYFLQDRLCLLAQEKLSTTDLAVSEIAYQLGFTSPQHFSRFFSRMRGQAPTDFRQSF